VEEGCGNKSFVLSTESHSVKIAPKGGRKRQGFLPEVIKLKILVVIRDLKR
jgi:hypothetical protein